MNDSNLGSEQPSRQCTNQNSVHPLQHYGDVLSDRRESIGGSCTSAELLFSAYGDLGSTQFKKCDSHKCILAILSLNPLIKLLVLLQTELILVQIMKSLI